MDTKRTVLVTVGTTEFQKLIDTVSKDDVLDLLFAQGYNCVRFQTGKSEFKQRDHPNLKISYTPYFENFLDVIDESDIVISHGGAGTCLDVLRRKKPLIVVINEDLMDNHQTELAEELEKNSYAYYCKIRDLRQTLNKDIKLLKSYPVPDQKLFSNYLNKCMGYTERNKGFKNYSNYVLQNN